jgi:hypothetical protein
VPQAIPGEAGAAGSTIAAAVCGDDEDVTLVGSSRSSTVRLPGIGAPRLPARLRLFGKVELANSARVQLASAVRGRLVEVP